MPPYLHWPLYLRPLYQSFSPTLQRTSVFNSSFFFLHLRAVPSFTLAFFLESESFSSASWHMQSLLFLLLSGSGVVGSDFFLPSPQIYIYFKKKGRGTIPLLMFAAAMAKNTSQSFFCFVETNVNKSIRKFWKATLYRCRSTSTFASMFLKMGAGALIKIARVVE